MAVEMKERDGKIIVVIDVDLSEEKKKYLKKLIEMEVNYVISLDNIDKQLQIKN